ncbi:hypothetical protein H4S07_006700 [Coemansia furcata]|uniref:Uncharacterized protein n=1 Tax=Coemansia furcata TaxID=417177 RepID=A0ACC1KSY9_9FUNG|nr:hypothetical protein H4S07_006700 [Coemansia furcata]
MLCSSLTSVNFSETCFLVPHLSRVLRLLSGVRKLVLNASTTDDDVLVAISLSMPNLEWLEIEGCGVSDVGICALAMEYPKLAYLNTKQCGGIFDTHLVQQINSGVWQEAVVYPKVYDLHHRVSNDDYDDGYECYDDFGAYDGKFYEYNYDKDDLDYYMDLERDFGRLDSYNGY